MRRVTQLESELLPARQRREAEGMTENTVAKLTNRLRVIEELIIKEQESTLRQLEQLIQIQQNRGNRKAARTAAGSSPIGNAFIATHHLAAAPRNYVSADVLYHRDGENAEAEPERSNSSRGKRKSLVLRRGTYFGLYTAEEAQKSVACTDGLKQQPWAWA